MTAKQIWMQILTEEEETAIEVGRKEWQPFHAQHCGKHPKNS